MRLATISEKTGLSTGLVIVLIGAVVTAVATGVTGIVNGQTNARDVETANKRIDALEAKQAAAQKESNDLALQIRDIQGGVARINDKVDDVKETLKEMRAGGVVQVKGKGGGY